MKTSWRMLGTKTVGERKVFDQAVADADKEALKAIHQQQIEKYGAELVGDFPELDQWPVRMCLVAERGGKIVDGYYFECSLELCGIGCDPEAAIALKRSAPALIQHFRKQKFRFIRTYIPRAVEKQVGKTLTKTGFRQQDQDLAHFLLDIR